VSTLLGAVLLAVAAVAAAIGVVWLGLDAVGSEWDYCRDGDCTAGWKMGAGFLVGALVVGLAGLVLLRQGRHGPRTDGRLT